MNVDEFHNLRRVSKNWIKVQETINSNKELVFLKTHSAFCNIEGNVFTNKTLKYAKDNGLTMMNCNFSRTVRC